jgi:hypothetical protein
MFFLNMVCLTVAVSVAMVCLTVASPILGIPNEENREVNSMIRGTRLKNNITN